MGISLVHVKQWYLLNSKRRTVINVVLWTLLVHTIWAMDLLSKFDDRWRYGIPTDDFRLIAEQITSANAVLLMLIPLSILCRVIYQKTFPLGVSITLFVAGSFLFAFGHHLLMVVQRALVYPFFSMDFVISNFWWNVWFEYKKDIKIYLIASIILFAYQYWIKRLIAELKQRQARLQVNTARGDTWIEIANIHYIKSDRNYAVIYDGPTEYLLRETLQSLLSRLPEQQFIRVHRSYIINLSQIKEVKYNQQGALEAHLTNGVSIPVGRSYQKVLKKPWSVIWLESLKATKP